MSIYKLAFIADIHYFSPSLGTSGRAYRLRSDSDQKCLAQTGAVFDAASAMLSSKDISAVCVAGDLTNDGERCSHAEIKEKLLALNEKKEVYVLTSTHDWCSDRKARRFVGNEVFYDEPTVSRDELAEMYGCFGEKREIARFRTSAGFYSRVFALSDELRLIMVNDDCDAAGGRSGYSEEHLAWMTAQIRKAKEEGACVIAAEHHLLLWNLTGLVNKGQSIGDNFEVASALADAGLRLMFVGHSHFQRTTEFTSPSGNKLTQVNVGSLSGYPAPVVFVEVNGGKARLTTEFLEGFTYEGRQYGAEFFREHTLNVFTSLLEAADDKEDVKERLFSNGIRIGHFDAVYPLIRFALKKTASVTVGTACRFLNTFTFGAAADMKALGGVKDERFLTHASEVFLSLFDGSLHVPEMKEEVRRTVCSIASLPAKAVRRLPGKKAESLKRTAAMIGELANELMVPSAPDNFEWTVDLL